MFSLAKKYRSRVKRLYIYHWKQPAPPNRFDAGLLRRDGTERPAFGTMRDMLNGPQSTVLRAVGPSNR